MEILRGRRVFFDAEPLRYLFVAELLKDKQVEHHTIACGQLAYQLHEHLVAHASYVGGWLVGHVGHIVR